MDNSKRYQKSEENQFNNSSHKIYQKTSNEQSNNGESLSYFKGTDKENLNVPDELQINKSKDLNLSNTYDRENKRCMKYSKNVRTQHPLSKNRSWTKSTNAQTEDNDQLVQDTRRRYKFLPKKPIFRNKTWVKKEKKMDERKRYFETSIEDPEASNLNSTSDNIQVYR